MAGNPSLLTAGMSVHRTLPETSEALVLLRGMAARWGVTIVRRNAARTIHEQLTGSATIPRPTGMPDTHPAVLAGVYA
mgnify:CR=1 FL=1